MGNQYPSTFPGYNQSSRPRPIPRDTRTNRHNVQRQQVPQHAAISLVPEGWRNWAEVTVKINGLPPDAQTIDVFHMCKDEGNIIRINLFEDRRGERTGDAEVTVSPPPDQPFWESAEWCIEAKDKWARTWTFTPRFSLKEPTRNFMHPSPINPHRKFPENFVLKAASLEFGFMYEAETMMVMRTIAGHSDIQGIGGITFTLSLLHREISVEFPALIPCLRYPSEPAVYERIKFQIPFRLLGNVWEISGDGGRRSLIISLDRSPTFFRKLVEVEETHNDGRHWNDRRGWARQTQIQHIQDRNPKQALKLRAERCFVDIGRWTTYMLTFDPRQVDRNFYNQARNAMQDYNVQFIHTNNFKVVPASSSTILDLLDDPVSKQTWSDWMKELTWGTTHSLAWSVRYQLEACISLGYINEWNLDGDFINELATMSEKRAQLKLELVVDSQRRFFTPKDIFNLPIPKRFLSRKTPKHCILQRSATVTPSTIYLSSPTVEMSNRILRKYQEHSDRFLRVRFTDEKHKGRLQPVQDRDDDSMLGVFNRVYQCLTQGITIGDRTYEFLASGNSQFRENGAYFFAPLPSLTAADIRADMGRFDDIKVVAKYASRLGQCFSTTRAIRNTRLTTVEIPDIVRNNFNFTDGVGKISTFAAQLIAGELGLPTSPFEVPSVFQFRMGGSKGVVAIAPSVRGREVHIRRSQYKFDAVYQGLEIIRWSTYSTPRLNRQLIAVMKSLKIRDAVYHEILEIELAKLDGAMTDQEIALQMLQQQIDFNQMSLEVASIVFDGFVNARDPFAVSVLRLWRSWSLRQLKEKAALPVQEGAFLLGCTDESASLVGYFKDAQPHGDKPTEMQRIRALPEIFVQISDPENRGKFKVVEGICIVARNPSLHPGDIRVVKAVDSPQLHHIRDAVVFPQTGDRDIPNMCSGGDLDGDDFIVIWDKRFIPSPELWNVSPMDFTAPTPDTVKKVTIDKIAAFFCEFLRNDRLRSIATWHLANADRLYGGVDHPRCRALAEQHSIAVDFPKSGIPAEPHPSLRPEQFPHFMPNSFRAKAQIYKSTTILGQLYDRVPDCDFRPLLDMPFDRRVLDAYPGNRDYEAIMSEVKAEYDAALRRIMAQHEIATEFEVWTTWVMDHARVVNDYKIHEEIGRISAALKEQFMDICYEKAGGKQFEVIAPWVVAMYTVTEREAKHTLDLLRNRLNKEELDEIESKDLPLISFPWLFHRELGKIARGKNFVAFADTTTAPVGQKQKKKVHTDREIQDTDGDKLVTSRGVARKGDLLELFKGDSQDVADPSPTTSKEEPAQPATIDAQDDGKRIDDDARAAMIEAAISGPSDELAYRPRSRKAPVSMKSMLGPMEKDLGRWSVVDERLIEDGYIGDSRYTSASSSDRGDENQSLTVDTNYSVELPSQNENKPSTDSGDSKPQGSDDDNELIDLLQTLTLDVNTTENDLAKRGTNGEDAASPSGLKLGAVGRENQKPGNPDRKGPAMVPNDDADSEEEIDMNFSSSVFNKLSKILD